MWPWERVSGGRVGINGVHYVKKSALNGNVFSEIMAMFVCSYTEEQPNPTSVLRGRD